MCTCSVLIDIDFVTTLPRRLDDPPMRIKARLRASMTSFMCRARTHLASRQKGSAYAP